MEEVRPRVVRHGRKPDRPWNARPHSVTGSEAGAAEEQGLIVLEPVGLDKVRDGPGPVVELDRARVRHLAAACRIERRLAKLREEESLLELLEGAYLREHVRLRIADELGLEVGAGGELRRALELTRAAGARHFAMALHLDLVAVDVDCLTALLCQL